MRHTFPGKLLLFGEYLVLQQGAALALPDNRYHTRWENKNNTDKDLIDYLQYLKQIDSLAEYLNLTRLEKHVHAGWHLESNLPQHKGLGSSASIVAALYDRYKIKKDSEVTMDELQEVFASMEHYMHGKSSGFDPLPIYFNQPILRKNNQSVIVNSTLPCLDNWRIELVDSETERQDGAGVDRFLTRIKEDKDFASKVDTLTKVNNKLVEAIIKNEQRIAENLLNTFSENQFFLFADWIPENIKERWDQNRQEENSAFKMLGAGGGGFFLKIHF
ncbi:hypothetical protein KUV50_17070 [Membranicola marinus]|uniref:GHMP kinase N-terminal domain-containing protein n=1 Tax=Membranihabitans marinus TaxID=1227546 RepID=A0A953HRE1_9BACT|nr:hypothetical protein [Membranihabitans marinus]MBY5959869.1 hypothetical protein [Membranihabitans marinus]